ncbi:protein kinase [Cryptosporidium ubiquitum]|uniref:Protein kinase n=1 Tax=Cryptosporidium ubiquitum TaxID=857276 RepID=A0A1J4MKB5_9CRYT|nr:protein kinase [Cryptosporidium ubiquitum]OII74706.1 protein kinase [Cryptosporidium ubiquitum]
MKRGFLKNLINTTNSEKKENETLKVKLDDFELYELIGTGNFTQVFRAFNVVNNTHVAIKVAIKSQLRALRKEDEILNEKKICTLLSNSSSRNVIKLLDSFANEDNVYLIYELCTGGELWQRILPIGIKPLKQAIYYLAQLLIAIEHIHNLNIIHRDIKAENCLLMENQQLKLADFGSSIHLDDIFCDSKNCNSSCSCRFKMNRGRREFKYFVGTPQFMAPETIRNKPPTKAVDLWSFGCTVFQVICGYPPFNAPSEFLVFCRVLQNGLRFPPDFPEDARQLVESLLKQEPTQRATIQEIKKHIFFKDIDFDKLTSEQEYPSFPPSLKDLCLIQVAKSYEKYKTEELDKLNALNDSSVVMRLKFETERKEYEGPRDTWLDEFSDQIFDHENTSKNTNNRISLSSSESDSE